MADNKRHSTAGKVATPKPVTAPQSNGDVDTTLSKSIGVKIRITSTNQKQPVEGTLFAACPITNVVAISTSAQPETFHIIPVSSIESFELLSLAPENNVAGQSNGASAFPAPGAPTPSLSKADLAALKARETAAIKEVKEREANKGKGVTKEGQEIYDHFKRTLPTRWHNTTIIVNESVLIEPPYKAENIKAPSNKQAQIPQIKRVLEGYHTKKRQSQAPQQQPQGQGQQAAQGGRPTAATPIPPRKGG